MRPLVRSVLARPASLVGLAALVHLIALYALDAAGIMDRLLAPSGLGAVLWAGMGAAFLALRVLLLLLGPGLLLGDLAWLTGQLIVRRAQRGSSLPG